MNDMRQGQQIIDFVNTHLFVALTLGIFGFIFWLAAWLIPLSVAWRARPPRGAALATRLPVELPFAILAASFVCLSLTSSIDRTIPWTMMSIGLICAFLTVNRNTLHAARPFRHDSDSNAIYQENTRLETERL
jgi:O-antigen ligase